MYVSLPALCDDRSCAMVSSYILRILPVDRAIGVATGFGLDQQRVEVLIPIKIRIFSSPSCPYRFWGPPNLLTSGYRVLFLSG
jgi:hypothetical protein